MIEVSPDLIEAIQRLVNSQILGGSNLMLTFKREDNPLIKVLDGKLTFMLVKRDEFSNERN